ncbi:hypothetical protein GKE62_07805 [Novosphingobium sp. Gsoil 351]|nr:hypothetical protein GKE62_07805 [Novosphingobium sp. Gsoil 351]
MYIRSGGKAIYRFEPLLSTRFIATFRIAITLVVVLAFWLDPLQPLRLVRLGHLLTAGYLGWGAINAWAAFRNWWIEFHLARSALLVDLSAGIAAFFLTEGAAVDMATPLAAFLMFILVEAIFIGGWRLAVKIGIAFTVGATCAVVALGFFHEAIDPFRTGRKIGSFLLITALAVWFGGRRTAPVMPALALPADLDAKLPLSEALRYACSVFGAKSSAAIWTTGDGGEPRLEIAGGQGAADWRVKPDSFDSLGILAGAPCLFDSSARRALSLDGADRFAVCDPAGFEHLPILTGRPPTVSLPVATDNLRAVLLLSDLHTPGRDLLHLAKPAAREIAAALDRHELSHRALADRMGTMRQDIARDLHDSVAQSLAGASFRVEAARKKLPDGSGASEDLRQVHDALLSEQAHVRTIIQRLRQGRAARVRYDLGRDLTGLLGTLGEQWRVEIKFTPPRNRSTSACRRSTNFVRSPARRSPTPPVTASRAASSSPSILRRPRSISTSSTTAMAGGSPDRATRSSPDRSPSAWPRWAASSMRGAGRRAPGSTSPFPGSAHEHPGPSRRRPPVHPQRCRKRPARFRVRGRRGGRDGGGSLGRGGAPGPRGGDSRRSNARRRRP